MSNLGSLEETVLLLVMVLESEAYGVSIASEHFKRHDREISIPAIHTVLKRLEKKGYFTSKYGGVSKERGGRRKRYYTITQAGYKVLSQVQEDRQNLWSLITRPSFS